MEAHVDAGDEVLLPDPYWSNYHGHVANTGADLVTVPTAAAEDFVPSPEAIAERITDDTAGIILNTPNNPTGAVVPPSTLREIGELLVEHVFQYLLKNLDALPRLKVQLSLVDLDLFVFSEVSLVI